MFFRRKKKEDHRKSQVDDGPVPYAEPLFTPLIIPDDHRTTHYDHLPAEAPSNDSPSYDGGSYDSGGYDGGGGFDGGGDCGGGCGCD